MPNELVCVAPDGSLELWVRDLSQHHAWCVMLSVGSDPLKFIDENDLRLGPQGNGRKILGDL